MLKITNFPLGLDGTGNSQIFLPGVKSALYKHWRALPLVVPHQEEHDLLLTYPSLGALQLAALPNSAWGLVSGITPN